MTIREDITPQSARAIAPAVVGMTALWVSVFNRLVYPTMHTYHQFSTELNGAVQAIYCVAFVAAALGFYFARDKLEHSLLARNKIVAAFGLVGSTGVAFPRLLSISGGAEIASVFVGALLVAAYISMHFTFWACRTSVHNMRNFGLSLTLSLALFFAVNLAFVLTGSHSIVFVIICPLVSAAMVLLTPQIGPQEFMPATPNATTQSKPAHGKRTEEPVVHIVSQTASDTAQSAPIGNDASAANARVGNTANAHAGTAAARGTCSPYTHPDIPTHVQENSTVFPLHEPVPDNIDHALAALVDEYKLSAREAELAALAYRNYSAKHIGAKLFIADSTVYTHLKRIYKKTGVHSRREFIELVDAFSGAPTQATPD